MHANKIEEIRVKVGFDFAFAVDREGCSGGVAVLWRKEVKCNVMNYSRNFFNLEVDDPSKGVWRLTGF